MGIGLLFPGQASQFPGMGKDLHDAYPVARRTFEEASEALSLDMAALCFLGTEEVLRMTENTQPAIFTVSVAAFRVLAAETGVRPTCAAGHSLGEYSALVAAGAKRALPLGVSAPFHCALMRPAADRLAPELRAIPQGPLAFPVVANVTAAPYGAGDVVADVLIRQITAPVRWEESVVAMRAAGADAFLEVGPGKVLSGLLRRIEKDAATGVFCGPADLDAARGMTA